MKQLCQIVGESMSGGWFNYCRDSKHRFFFAENKLRFQNFANVSSSIIIKYCVKLEKVIADFLRDTAKFLNVGAEKV